LNGAASVVTYLVAARLAFTSPLLTYFCYAAVAAWWLIPDGRIERVLPAE
jgi:hypothetical protein